MICEVCSRPVTAKIVNRMWVYDHPQTEFFVHDVVVDDQAQKRAARLVQAMQMTRLAMKTGGPADMVLSLMQGVRKAMDQLEAYYREHPDETTFMSFTGQELSDIMASMLTAATMEDLPDTLPEGWA